MIKKIQNPKSKIKNLYLVISLSLIIAVFLVGQLRTSLFLKGTDRVNLVVYGKYPIFYSLGLKNKINYKIQFYPDLKLEVPGGYGFYRTGAIGKLVRLEKNPELFKKAFSMATFSFIDYYFYPRREEIYYGGEGENKSLPIVTFKNNANFFDRLYLFLFFYTTSKHDFIQLTPISSYKTYLGYLYQAIYRKEKLNLQLIYQNRYNTVALMSKIIEGTGIRVVDISKDKDIKARGCLIIENNNKFSQTAYGLASFFDCALKRGKTEVSDIIFFIRDKENEWEMN